uniref:Uncharacterized protein n=1 Tax=viral metagenome TaxID=1070528 RepID=A0A2V0RBY0_9ZZZZ
MGTGIKKRPMSQVELEEMKVKIKVVYLEEGQTEDEAIEEEAKDKKEGEEIYLVVLDKGEKLPSDKEEKLQGYSVDNPYHDEKEEQSSDSNKEQKPNSTTTQVSDIIAKHDVEPVPEVKVDDPSSRVLDIAQPVDNYLTGVKYMDITPETITDKTFMTLDAKDDLGYMEHSIRQAGAVENNYKFMTRNLGSRPAGNHLGIMLDIVDESLTRARQPKKYYIAPKKKNYDLRYQVQPQLLCDVGVVERLQALQTELLDSNKFIQGQTPEQRRIRAKALDDVIEELTLKSSDDSRPKGFDDPIPTKEFDTLCDQKILDLKMNIAEIDKECMVDESYYDPIYTELQTTDKQVARPDPEYIKHRKEFYDTKVELHRPDLMTQFLQHPRNREFAGKVTIPQIMDSAYRGAVLPLSNVGDTSSDFATSLGMSATTVSSDGKLANMASAATASRFLHDYIGALLHEDVWLRYPLISTQRMYTQFDLAIMMDALFYPCMLNFLVVSFEDIRALRNYVYYFVVRPVFDVTDILGDNDSGKDMLHDFLVGGMTGVQDRSKRELFGAMRRYFGTADYSELSAQNREQSFTGVPNDYTSNLSNERGAYKEVAIDGVLDDYIFREKRDLLFCSTRHGKPGGVMLNGNMPTVSEKPRVGIWTHANEFANKFHTVMSDANMRRVIAAVDGNTIISMAKIFKKVIETRTVGFQHRLNEMNYFTHYMGKFGFAFPKSILQSLNYDWDRTPEFKEIQPGSIFSSVALTTVSDLRSVVLPDASLLVDSLNMYNNLEEFMVMKQLVYGTYSPAALQEYAQYDRPIKREDNTDKKLLMKAFELYGGSSPIINALLKEINAVTLDYFDSWYFPDEEIRRDVMPKHTLTRKFMLYFQYLNDPDVRTSYGLTDSFWLSRLEPDENIDEDTNGGLTRKTRFKAIRRVDTKPDNDTATHTYNAEEFFNTYVQGEDFDALFKHMRAIKKGEAHVKVNMPVRWSIGEMNPTAADELSSKEAFPISWTRDSAMSVSAKDITLNYWPSYTVTGEREFDEKYMFTNDKYARLGFSPIMVTDDRFTTMEDLLIKGKLIKKVKNIPERPLTLRPKREYYNPMMYDTGNL